jgi:diguanylate cyclase (GGDEF)-like protein
MKKIIQQLNLRRYLPFLAPCSLGNYALCIFNQFGTRQLLEANELNDEIISILGPFNNQSYNWDKINTGNSPYRVAEKGYFHIVALSFGATEQQCWLAGLQRTQQKLTTQQIEKMNNSLNTIAQCLQEDYALSETLIGMTNELAVRYEELNLLYGIDDAETSYKGSDERESLAQLLTNCIDYLNIDLAIFYFPDLEIYLHQTNDNVQIDHELISNIVYQKIYPYITKNLETLVINRDQDSDWTDAGLTIPYKLIVSPIVKSNQQISGILVFINDIYKTDFSNSDRKLSEILAAEASKLMQSRRDSVTGQLNRRGITEKLDKVIALNNADTLHYCLLLINIDQFKVINDTAGQVGGDQLLKQINSLIQKTLKKTDDLGRLGADEFMVILNACTLADAKIIADRIRVIIKQFRYFFQEKLFDISACIGVVELTDEFDGFSDAIRAADLACSVAKEEGRNRTHVYEKDDENLITHENQMQWVSRINLGIEENRFQLYRQRILPLQGDESLHHYEILLRFKDENGDILSPFHFISAAERYNLMSKLDQWVVKNTLEKMAHINRTEPQNTFTCSINLSGQSFCEEGFSSFIIEQINKSGIAPQHICFEITETAAVSNMAQTVEFIEKVKAIGCTFSLDDFGSGMSSFTYLKNLPVDYLKIDGYFVKTLLENEIDKAMVASIHQIGNVMGLKTVAEFVENDAILEEIKNMGIDYGQGYGIGKPEPF